MKTYTVYIVTLNNYKDSKSQTLLETTDRSAAMSLHYRLNKALDQWETKRKKYGVVLHVIQAEEVES